MSSIRLIVSDIDGTILDQQHQVDPNLIELIPQLQEKKIPFILASARSQYMVEEPGWSFSCCIIDG